MSGVPPQMEAILGEVDRALQHDLLLLAVTAALIIPDVCTSLAFHNPDSLLPPPATPERCTIGTYAPWCDTYLPYKSVSGRDLYRIRCGAVHHGNYRHSKSRFARVVFVGRRRDGVPQPFQHDEVVAMGDEENLMGQRADRLRLGGKLLVLDAVQFCSDMRSGAEKWYAVHAGDANVIANLPNLVRNHRLGLPPIWVGVPVIA